MSNLVPVQRMDINGKMVTRWVKSGADGKAAPRGIPVPKTKSRTEMTESVCSILFPTMDDAEYPKNINGIPVFYSFEFAEQSISLLPARTIKLLNETLERLPEGEAKRTVAQMVYDHIREMSDMAGTAALKDCIAEQNLIVSNTCVFADSIEALSKTPGSYGKRSVSDLVHQLSLAITCHEGGSTEYIRNSKNDYSSLPAGSRERVQDEVMAQQLHYNFSSSDTALTEDHIKLVSEQRGNWDALALASMERGFSDPALLSEMLSSETPAISSGVL